MRQVKKPPAQTLPGNERPVAAAVLLVTLLVAAGCGASNTSDEPPPSASASPSALAPTQSIPPTPTGLPLPGIRPDRTALYYLTSASLTGTSAGALALGAGSSLWHTSVPGGVDALVLR